MKNKFKLTAISLYIASRLPAVGFADLDKSNETLYTLSNDAGQNEVLAFQRINNGHMEAAGHFAYIEDPDGALIEFVETHKVPILKKLGWYLDLRKRDPKKSLPDWILKTLRFSKVKV